MNAKYLYKHLTVFFSVFTSVVICIWITEFRFTLHSGKTKKRETRPAIDLEFCQGPIVFAHECTGVLKVIRSQDGHSSKLTLLLNSFSSLQRTFNTNPMGFLFVVDSTCEVLETISVYPTNHEEIRIFVEHFKNKSFGGVLHRTAHWIEHYEHLGIDVKDIPCEEISGNGDLLFMHQLNGPVQWSIVLDSGSYELKDKLTTGQPFTPDLNLNNDDWVSRRNNDVSIGGSWRPPDCMPTWHIALIIPYRKREEHRAIFLQNIIPFLKKQKIQFTIFIVDQAEPEMFNRAALMNVGYLEAKALGRFDCYVFHDIDKIPLNLANVYRCDNNPRHLTVVRLINNERRRFNDLYEYFGGAIVMTSEQIDKINGFSNRFYGWGGEDDEMLARIITVGYDVLRYPEDIALYMSLEHERDEGNPKVMRDLEAIQEYAMRYFKSDGLNSVNYTMLATEKHALYTRLYVKIPGPRNAKELERVDAEFQKMLTL